MSTAARLGAFAAALAIVFAAALGLGKVVGPTDRAGDDAAADGHGGDGMAMSSSAAPQGLAVAAGGYRLIAQRTTFAAGRPQAFRFRIAGAGGRTVRDFALEHERRLHLIVVRRDATRYVHVHPEQLPDGSWTTPLRFRDPGTYRVFADFTAAGGERTTLGTDVFVPGAARTEPLPAPSTRATTDGYDVALTHDDGELAFAVTRGGEPVQVEPYLGADGHLVALREGDLAYLHVHTVEGEGGGPIRFEADWPSSGRYRLFLQFKDGGKVHTVAFTQEID